MQAWKKYSLIVFMAIVINILQQSIFSNIKIFDVSIDIVLTFVICYSLVREEVECVIFALICGLIRDSFFPVIFGLNTISYILIAYILCNIEKKIYKDSIMIPMILTFVATIFQGILEYAYFFIASIKFDFYLHFVYIIPIEALMNSIVSIIVFKLINKISKLKFMQQEWKF